MYEIKIVRIFQVIVNLVKSNRIESSFAFWQLNRTRTSCVLSAQAGHIAQKHIDKLKILGNQFSHWFSLYIKITREIQSDQVDKLSHHQYYLLWAQQHSIIKIQIQMIFHKTLKSKNEQAVFFVCKIIGFKYLSQYKT